MSKLITLQGVDVLDTIGFLVTKNKRFQSTVLNQLEEILQGDEETYMRVRKIYLDASNSFLRTVLRTIFGNVESNVR